ncbi:formin-binding protein 4 isoform X2 [Fopius arisanus]|uniref:Formin-binding protein 4 isoform X2 n=1 Tax=Fopius arisanus TaxID=64838 RepID=A0A9R1U9W0_9HYME|nr:PREDICTED: formin-binding protein 4-like isoform X2 [Fopius arisanus]
MMHFMHINDVVEKGLMGLIVNDSLSCHVICNSCHLIYESSRRKRNNSSRTILAETKITNVCKRQVSFLLKMPSNPLTNLLEQYNSDTDDEDGHQPGRISKTKCLDKKVDDFLKEIQHITPNTTVPVSNKDQEIQKSGSHWQECFDESTGYPYYWNTQTNQVTWDIPKEFIKKGNNQDAPQTSGRFQPYEAPRHTPPLNRYKLLQDKIPEGMIPKEVVERSKNRFREKKKIVVDDKVEKKSLNESRDSDSDDGRIEMITSFGSDGSESEVDDEIISKTNDSPVNINSELSADDNREDVKIGPTLPQFQINSSSDNSRENGDVNSDEQRTKFSLVPGYADDSDNDDESVVDKNRKTLFPITEFEDKMVGVVKKLKNPNCIEASNLNGPDGDKKSVKIEENSKANKFLETCEAPTKAFQRKRRIGFDVRPKHEVKAVQVEANSDTGEKSELIRGNNERLGFGFSKSPLGVENSEDNANTNDSDKKSMDSEKNESGISFVRGETLNLPPVIDEKNETEKIQTKQEIDNILEKLKFLSEGFQSASAVQIMTIQLQTLLTAWEGGDLKDRYLDNWLSGTSRELSRLEKVAAPSGWSCQWDRSHKRYYYQNESTGETRWNYPDVIGGAEEMELCTTPPPTDNEVDEMEETKSGVINGVGGSGVEGLKGDPVLGKNDAIPTETTDASSEMIPPPPPQISSPSPPPPPRINAEDLKKGKKSKANDDKISTPETPEVSLPPLVGSEPLPPGVDSPEISFSIGGSHPSIEPTVIFAAAPQSTNPPSMYAAATMQDPTSVSILGHHHPALLQSQLVHYPAYHQHLHNQAILAAANRLTGQDTVQFLLDFPRIYTNTQVIAKPPITTNKESLGSALNSFYSDIASLERPVEEHQAIPSPQLIAVESQPIATTIPETTEKLSAASDVYKEKRKKKVKNVVSKKQKQVSSMVAKWQKAQNYEGSN